MVGGWGASNPGEFETAPGSGEYYIEPVNFADFFDGYRTGMSPEAEAFLIVHTAVKPALLPTSLAALLVIQLS
jgi:hypothetical protein